ncbi:MAG: hypothetical protein IKJ01_07700 [Lachnospiraceae bacterium]|nr:hypothetical protein [Lachnospiraceae bacterium]
MYWKNNKEQFTKHDFFEQSTNICSKEEFAEKIYIMIHSNYLKEDANRIAERMQETWKQEFGIEMSEQSFEYMRMNNYMLLADWGIQSVNQKKEITNVEKLKRLLVALEFDLWLIERYQSRTALRYKFFNEYLETKYGSFLENAWFGYRKYNLLHIWDKNYQKLAEALSPYYEKILVFFQNVVEANEKNIQVQNKEVKRTDKLKFIQQNTVEQKPLIKPNSKEKQNDNKTTIASETSKNIVENKSSVSVSRESVESVQSVQVNKDKVENINTTVCKEQSEKTPIVEKESVEKVTPIVPKQENKNIKPTVESTDISVQKEQTKPASTIIGKEVVENIVRKQQSEKVKPTEQLKEECNAILNAKEKNENKVAKPDDYQKKEREYQILLAEKEKRIEQLEDGLKEYKRQKDEMMEYSMRQYDTAVKHFFGALNDVKYGKIIDYFYSLLEAEDTEENLAGYLENFFIALEDMNIEPIVTAKELCVKEETMLKDFNLQFDKSQYDASKVALKYTGWKYKSLPMEKPTIMLKEE